MNPITFNDPFMQPIIQDAGKHEFAQMAVAPLFDYRVRLADLTEHLKRGREIFADEDGKFTFPFKRLRLEFRAQGSMEDFDALANQRLVAFVAAPRAEKGDLKFISFQVMVRADGLVYYRLSKLPREYAELEQIMLRCKMPAEDGSQIVHCLPNDPVEISWYRKGQWIPMDESRTKFTTWRHITDLKHTVIVGLTAFAYDAMLPSHYTAEVKPAQEHRSVEWQRARTHYTLITHGHPANKPMREGARVQSDQEGELHRMAHNRRAHFRTMRHERYRFTRGQRIFVRATWVGPKEWKDEGGRQIYRILEPVDTEPKAVGVMQ